MARSSGGWRERLSDAGHRTAAWGQLFVLLGLTGFAISQPLLGVLGEEPTWFTFRGAARHHIIAFALIVALVPPLVLWGAGLAFRRVSRTAGTVFHLLVVAALVGVTVLQLLRSMASAPAAPSIAAAVAAGLAFAAGYASYRAVGLWTRYTFFLPLLAVGSFLLASPTADLVAASSSPGVGSPTEASDLPSVLFIMLDELPSQSLLDASGGVDRVRFPNLAALADEGTWYPTYSSSGGITSAAVPSILSGKAPTADPPIYPNHPDTLFSLLAPTHQMRVAETATALCDPGTCPDISPHGSPSMSAVLRELFTDGTHVWGQRISGPDTDAAFADFEVELESTLLDQIQGPALEERWRAVRQRPEALADLIETIGPTDEPTLWYAHLMLPHQPWVLYPDGTRYRFPGFPENLRMNASDPWLLALDEQRHLLQLQFTDALVGQVLDALRESGEYDDTVVVVTADHGVSLIPDSPKRTVTPTTMDRIAYVPLIIKGRDGEPRVSASSNLLSEDLLPTIAALVGVEVPWDVQGHAVGSAAQARRGPIKEVHDFGSGLQPAFRSTLEFDLRERAPMFDDRWVGTLEDGEDPIAGLLERIRVDAWLGRALDDVAVATVDVRADIEAADAFRDPGDVPPGIAVARLAGEVRSSDVVLLQVNGAVVTAAPVTQSPDHGPTAFFLLPPGALDESGNGLELALLRGGEVLRIEAE